MTVMRMLIALIPLEVTTAAVTLAMREMDSTAQVTQQSIMYLFFVCLFVYNKLLLFCGVQLPADSILTDINECQLGTDLCVNAECDNTAGSYTCTCLPGFIPQNLTTCSKFCLHMLGTMSLEFALHEMILSTCFVYISQIAQMVTSG